MYSSVISSGTKDIEEASHAISDASSNINLDQVSQIVTEATNDLSHLTAVAAQGISEGLESVAATVSATLGSHDEGESWWNCTDQIVASEHPKTPQEEGKEGVQSPDEPDALDTISQFLSESFASVAQGVETVSASVNFDALGAAASEGMNTVAESISQGVDAVMNFADSATKQINGEEVTSMNKKIYR